MGVYSKKCGKGGGDKDCFIKSRKDMEFCGKYPFFGDILFLGGFEEIFKF